MCKKCIDAVKETEVPIESNKYRCFKIDSIDKFNALIGMSETLPGLQQFSVGRNLGYKGGGDFKYTDGEDPVEESTAAADGVTTLNLDDLLSKFPKVSYDN